MCDLMIKNKNYDGIADLYGLEKYATDYDYTYSDGIAVFKFDMEDLTSDNDNNKVKISLIDYVYDTKKEDYTIPEFVDIDLTVTSASSDTIIDGYCTYTVNDDGTLTLSNIDWIKASDVSVFRIPYSVKDHIVTGFLAECFNSSPCIEHIYEVEILAPIKEIPTQSFIGYTNLQEVKLAFPQELVEIGDGAFQGCTSLHEITKYSETGLSEQGSVNADIVDNGGGITGVDSLALQAIEAGLLTQDMFPMSSTDFNGLIYTKK